MNEATPVTLFALDVVTLVPMTPSEARAYADEIRAGISNIRQKLLELYERDGWRALGYSNWRECAQQEFQLSQPRAYQLLSAAEVERNISTIVENSTSIIESHLRPLNGLLPEEQRELWQAVIDTAPSGKITAAHVKATVGKIKGQLAQQQRRQANQRTYQENGHEPFIPASHPTIHIHNVDARYLSAYTKNVHLAIMSPPYNVGIDYGGYEDNRSDYLPWLTEVWQECFKVMVDGARIAVVVPFGVGRNPYTIFVSEVAKTLTEAGFSLGAHITWDKGTTGNSTAWGSFRSPSKPSVRDRDECIIVAHKGDGALAIPDEHLHKDSVGTYTTWLKDGDYFMELMQSVWLVPPESAQRVGHPAPFPTKLVQRLIHAYGYPGCHVLDPFAGSGTVGVVAKELGCQASLFEINPDYCALAQERINAIA